MKFLVFGDIVEKKEELNKMANSDLSKYDFLFFNGDLLTMKVFKKIRESKVLNEEEPEKAEKKKKYYKEKVETEDVLEEYIEMANKFRPLFKKIKEKTDLVGIWGNADHAKVISESGIKDIITTVHGDIFSRDGFNFVGYEGRPKYIFEDYENPTEHAFEEKRAYEDLSSIFEGLESQKSVLITHAPPFEILDQVEPDYREYAVGTYGEKAKNGHVGSDAFRKIDEEFKPRMHIFGHIHEEKGVHKEDETLYVNTGSFGKDGETVQVRITDKSTEVKFQDVENL